MEKSASVPQTPPPNKWGSRSKKSRNKDEIIQMKIEEAVLLKTIVSDEVLRAYYHQDKSKLRNEFGKFIIALILVTYKQLKKDQPTQIIAAIILSGGILGIIDGSFEHMQFFHASESSTWVYDRLLAVITTCEELILFIPGVLIIVAYNCARGLLILVALCVNIAYCSCCSTASKDEISEDSESSNFQRCEDPETKESEQELSDSEDLESQLLLESQEREVLSCQAAAHPDSQEVVHPESQGAADQETVTPVSSVPQEHEDQNQKVAELIKQAIEAQSKGGVVNGDVEDSHPTRVYCSKVDVATDTSIGSDTGDDDKAVDAVTAQLKNMGLNLSTCAFSTDELSGLVTASMGVRTSQFCFVRCLHASDQKQFIERYIEYMVRVHGSEAVVHVTSGRIKLQDWEKVMNACCFTHTYRIFRKAYWGENTGNSRLSNRKTNYDALVVVFGDGPAINLLINNYHIMDVGKDIRRSGWVNESVGFYWSEDVLSK